MDLKKNNHFVYLNCFLLLLLTGCGGEWGQVQCYKGSPIDIQDLSVLYIDSSAKIYKIDESYKSYDAPGIKNPFEIISGDFDELNGTEEREFHLLPGKHVLCVCYYEGGGYYQSKPFDISYEFLPGRIYFVKGKSLSSRKCTVEINDMGDIKAASKLLVAKKNCPLRWREIAKKENQEDQHQTSER